MYTDAEREGMHCGIPQHPMDCLCDVVIDKPVEMNYSFTALPGAKFIARKHGLGEPWDGRQLAILLDELALAKDALDLSVRSGNVYHGYGLIVKARLKAGVSIVDMPGVTGFTWDEVVRSLNGNQNVQDWYDWPQSRWVEFETDVRARRLQHAEMMEKYSLTQHQIRALSRAFGIKGKASTKRRRPRRGI